MITQIDNENRERYEALFKKAVADLNNDKIKQAIDSSKAEEAHPEKISSLEEYFTYIYNLVNLETDTNKTYGRKYTILPIQEEYFEIDANARTITVPEIFRKNGIGVAGDQAAETIYFKVNRYFDAMDLNNTDIYIQWKNSNNDSGISKEWVRDIDTFDDYLVFGWVLGQDILQQSGTLQFSIRFINPVLNDDGYATSYNYSLNTLRAQVLVNPGLDVSLIENKQNDYFNTVLLNNIKNTTTKTDSELKIFDWSYLFENLINADKSNFKDDMVYADLIDGALDLFISAYSDKGDINYQLYKENNDNSSSDYAISSNMDYGYVSAKGKTFNQYIDYYKKEEDDTYSFQKNYMGEKDPDTGVITVGDGYYEKCGKYTLTESAKEKTNGTLTGNYYGTATVKMTDGSITSPITTTIKVKLQPPTKAIIETSLVNYGYENSTATILNPTVKYNEKEVINYKWFKKTNEQDFVKIKDGSEVNCIPNGEGIYKLQVTTTRNLDSIDCPETPIYYVTNRPKAEDIIPTYDKDLFDTSKDGETAFAAGNQIDAIATYTPTNQLPNTEYNLSYQWQIQNNQVGDYVDIPNATESSLQTSQGVFAAYKCIVTATYNNLSTSRITHVFKTYQL